ncbi:(d)CMP kinase [Nakamurella sp. YIM 132087]|uniref:Cytidylate kinase n=1 Tax=Nakamurella alba TaxID=2665158 RepID=A0A7K1FR21_9ACTN|nr:(d)CMP kinase [Nakamurella alba]MTD16602.1 (d)CMP kinase [Nakamurella alba]
MTSGTAVPAGGFVIAIDGPSGTGKSTVARRVAGRLGAGYLDTGAMYRIVTLAVLRSGVDPADDAAVAALLPTVDLVTPTDPDAQRHRLGDVDVSDEIRGQHVTLAVTPVSANPAVRAFLKQRQQDIAHSGRMVVEGRDIGTVIAPDATLKIYLTADAQERARRRHGQNRSVAAHAGQDLAAVALDLQRRDSHDQARTHAPLQAAEDAVLVDSSTLEAHETVSHILRLASERGIR